MEVPGDGAGDVVAAVTNNLPRDVGATMPTLRAMKQKVHRARAAAGINPHAPPDSINGWEVPDELAFFEDGTRCKLYDSGADDPERFIIFGSDMALEQLGVAINFFSDGTFKEVPQFQQLYSIHSLVVSI